MRKVLIGKQKSGIARKLISFATNLISRLTDSIFTPLGLVTILDRKPRSMVEAIPLGTLSGLLLKSTTDTNHLLAIANVSNSEKL